MAETLATRRCPLCNWVGDTDREHCDRCGHGLVAYRITLEG